MAQNDWIVAGLNNPTFTTSDFADIADMTVDNTQMLQYDDYLKSDFIKNNSAFADQNGNFSEDKFAAYYQQRLADFGDFQEQDFQKGPALSMFDIMRTPESPIRDIKFTIQRGVNPDRQQIGIEGVNVWSDPRFSKRELAKQNKVFNYEENRFEDYTPDERVLSVAPLKWLKDMFSEPLVMATWDEDGTHIDPLTGIEQQHHKGEYKLNDKGTYYYETLGGRSPMGKEVLTWNDTLSVDGQGINKYDFLDSNDIKKSAGGIVGRTVASLIPLFCGPVVGGVYSAALIARELSKSLPMLYGMVTALVNDSDSPAWLNKLAAYGERASWSQADYDKEHMFSFGNIANTLSDVALQWGQQQLIAKAFGAARGSQKIIEEARKKALALYDAKKVLPGIGESPELLQVCMNKFMPAAEKAAQQAGQLGRDLSLVYMAIISNQDVYQDMLDHGTSKKEAAAVALGSSVGMFAVDKWLHLGELFFDEATPDITKQARQAMKDEIAAVREQLNNVASSNAALHNKFFGLFSRAADAGKRAMHKFSDDLKYHTTGFFGKALGEGLEEVAEEVVSDFSKQIYEWAGDLGCNTSVRDVGAWDNAFDRYAMNFLGGALGGSVFYGKSVWDRGTFQRPHLDTDIATLIRNGHVDELRKQLADLYEHGRTGSRKLSSAPQDVKQTEDGKLIWLTTNDESKSQGKAVVDLVNDRINQIEEVLLTNRDANMSDDELFMNMVLSEKRYQRYRGLSGLTGYYQDYGQTLNDLVQNQLKYNRSLNTIDGLPTGKVISTDRTLGGLPPEMQEKRKNNLEAQLKAINDSKQKLKDFLSGDMSLRYTRMLNFAMDYEMFSPFIKLDMNSYAQELYHKDLKDLTEQEQEDFYGDKWPTHVNTELPTKLKDAYRRFEELENEVTPELATVEESSKAYRSFVESLSSLTSSGVFSQKAYEEGMILKPEDRIEGESDADYNDRNTQREGESKEDFNRRRYNRLVKIDQINSAQEEKWAKSVLDEFKKVDNKVDPATLRYIKRIVINHGRLKDIIQRKVKSLTNDTYLYSLFEAANTDLSNLNELRQAIVDDTRKEVFTNTKTTLQGLMDMSITTPDGQEATFGELISDMGTALLEIMNDPNSEVNQNLSDASKAEVHERLAEILNNNNLPSDTLATLNGAQISSLLTGMGKLDDLATLSPELLEAINLVASQKSKSREDSFIKIAEAIQRSPVFRLQNDLETSIVNPIGVLVKNVAARVGGDKLVDVEQILQMVQDKFDGLKNAGDFRLESVQRDQLEMVWGYLELLKLYIYAASTTPDMEAFVGHNKSINEFARTHKDKLTKEWKRLPEIDVDVATFYINSIDEYQDEIKAWEDISDANQLNKLSKIKATEPAVLKAKAKVWKSITGSFTMNGQPYQPAEGLDAINLDAADGADGQSILYQAEKRFYSNILKVARANGMSIAEVVANSDLLSKVLPGIDKITKQRTSDLDTFTVDNCELTDYDKLLYIVSVLAEDPDIYYNRLKTRIAESPDMVPIVSQEHGSRILQAFYTQDYKDMMEHARTLMPKSEAPALSNFAMAEGLAGTGKSSNMAVSAIQAIGDVPMIMAGPTSKQAEDLKGRIGRGTAMTIDEIMIRFYGEDEYKSFKDAINSPAQDTKWYSINPEGSDGMAKVHIKKDGMKLLKPEGESMPKLIVIDEATHMPTATALWLNEAAKAYGITVLVLGNFSQNGYTNEQSGMQNLDEGAVSMVRTPRLTLSMRNNNLQKFQNNDAIYEFTEEVRKNRLDMTEAEYFAQYTSIRNRLKGTSLVAYVDDDINGDMFTAGLSEDIISKLKAISDNNKSADAEHKKTIAFICDSEASPNLKILTDAGVQFTEVLDFAKMQGQEFDYIVVDHQFNKVGDMPSLRKFVNDLYTAITRAREGSVLLDKGLSDVLGTMSYSHHKVAAPSIKESIDELRATKKAMLDSLDLPEIKEETVEEEKEAKKDAADKGKKKKSGEGEEEEENEENNEEEKGEEGESEEEEEETSEEEAPATPEQPEPNASDEGLANMNGFEQRLAQINNFKTDGNKAKKFNDLWKQITAEEDKGTAIPETLRAAIDSFYDYMKSKGYSVAENGYVIKDGKLPPAAPTPQPTSLVDAGRETSKQTPSTDTVSAGKFMDKMFTDPDNPNNTEAPTITQDMKNVSNEDVPKSIYSDSAAGVNYNINGFFVTGYGDTLPLGIEEDETNTGFDYEYDDEEGVHHKARSEAKKWTVRKSKAEGTVYRNLQALVNPGEDSETIEALRYEDKVNLEREFGKAHSYISFEHTWDDAPECIKRNFNKEEWEDGKYQYEIRRADPRDRFPLEKTPELETFGVVYTDENGRTFGGGDNLMFNLVFAVKDKSGHLCKLDLARMNDPRTLIKNLPRLRKDMTAQLAELEKNAPDSPLVAKLRDLLDKNSPSCIEPNAHAYKNWFEQQLAKLDNQNSVVYDLPPEAIEFSKYTGLKKRDTPLQLGERIDLNDPDNKSFVRTLRDLNPTKSISKVYVFTGVDVESLGIDPSVVGRACIFVSDDLLIKPTDLIKRYVAQKENPNLHTPVVRLYVLNNQGLSMSEISSKKFLDTFQESNKYDLPFNQSYTGVRMFTSMWNSRASLIKFNNALADFKENYKTAKGVKIRLSNAQLEAILKVHRMAFEHMTKAAMQTVLDNDSAFGKGNETVEHALQMVNEFNNKTLKDVPMFRLGWYANTEVGKNKGFYVQKLTVSGSSMYSDGDHNFCFLTPAKALQFQKILDVVLGSICRNDASKLSESAQRSHTLNVGLYHVTLNENNEEVESRQWAPTELIDLNDDAHRLTLSGMITQDSDTGRMELIIPAELEVKEGSNTIVPMLKGDFWSYIPRVVQRYIRTANFWAKNYSNLASEAAEDLDVPLEYVLFDNEGNVIQKSALRLDIASLFAGESPLIEGPTRTTNSRTGQTKVTVDYSLNNMFDIIFHGTVENVRTSKNPKVDYAYFPNGCYINPDATMDSKGTVISIKNGKGEAFLYQLGTSEAFYAGDSDILGAYINVNIQALIDPEGFEKAVTAVKAAKEAAAAQQEQAQQAANVVPETPVSELSSSDSSFVSSMQNMTGETYANTKADLARAEAKYISKNNDDLVLRGAEDPDSIDLSMNYAHADGRYYTLQQWLVTKYNAAGGTIRCLSDHISFKTKDGNAMRFNYENGEVVADTETGQDILREAYNGTTVYETLTSILGSDDFKNAVRDSSLVQEALDRINDIYENSQSVNDDIRDLMNDPKFGQDFWTATGDEDLIDKLYAC